MSDFLQSMAAASRERVARASRLCSLEQLRALALAAPPAPGLRLSRHGFDLIAEVKRRSPSSGRLARADAAGERPASSDAATDVARRALEYAGAGAAAVSVLTEPGHFDGELAHLARACEALTRTPGSGGPVPALRKDFLTSPYQLYEARCAGAGGALLIVRLLTIERLAELLEVACELGLFVLLESFDEADATVTAQLVRSFSARLTLLAGANCRDLSSLQVIPDRLEGLLPALPAQVPRVAESGVHSAADAARLASSGYELALVGQALMQSNDPGRLVHALLEGGRKAAAARAANGARGAASAAGSVGPERSCG